MINIIQNTIGASQKASGVASILPIAYNVLITGDFIEGVTLAGSYQYTDPNSVPQGVTTFKWYRAADSIGTGKTVVSTTQSYTVLGSDEGDYISFEVTPKNTNGDVGTPRATTYAEVPIPLPLANSVSYGSVLFQGETLTGAYTYVENGSAPEGTTTFKWYTATDSSGTGKVAIVGATSQTYILQATDKDNFISFEVTPVTNTGVSGASVQTAYQTAIGGLPVATNVVYTGVVQVGEIQTGSYDYSGAPEGSSGKYWYRYNSVGGGSATYLGSGSTYTIIAADEGNTIKFRVIPKSVSGVAGTNVYSPTRGVVAPSAFTGLLDTYSGAAVGYSLRQLSSTYSGNCIKVRRASDSTELDIGFVNNVLDTASLATFCSGTDGFVSVWYDQSGNAKPMFNTSASRQPKIVTSGSILLENGKPILTSDGSTSGMTSDYIADSGVSAKGLFIVTKRNSSTNQCILGSYSDGNNINYILDSGSTSTSVNLNVAVTSQKLNGSSWVYTNRGGVYTDLSVQSIISANAVYSFGVDTTDALSLGYRYTSPVNFEMTNMQELVIFENQTDQAAKETAINSFYNAY